MRQFTALETLYQVLQAQVTVQRITKHQAVLEPLHLDLALVTTLVDCASYQVPFTMEIPTLVIQEKTGVQEVTGHAFHGRTP